jgi:hypothetical protein
MLVLLSLHFLQQHRLNFELNETPCPVPAFRLPCMGSTLKNAARETRPPLMTIDVCDEIASLSPFFYPRAESCCARVRVRPLLCRLASFVEFFLGAGCVCV